MVDSQVKGRALSIRQRRVIIENFCNSSSALMSPARKEGHQHTQPAVEKFRGWQNGLIITHPYKIIYMHTATKMRPVTCHIQCSL